MKLPSLKALALVFVLFPGALPDARGELPGTYQTTWVGNTFEGAGPSGKGRWVQNMIASTPFSPPSGLAQRLFQEPPAKSKFLAVQNPT